MQQGHLLFDRPAPTIVRHARLKEQALAALHRLKDVNEVAGAGIRFYFPADATVTAGEIDAFLQSYDPDLLSAQEQAAAQREAVKASVDGIPGWATWTEQQALDHINANVTDLPGAIVVLKAMARLLVALRDRNWPGLV